MSLKPYPGYKDSAVEWLGDVPEHWDLVRLATTVESTRNGVWGDEPDGLNDVRCVRVADFDRPRQRISDRDVTLRSVSAIERSERGLRRGDLLLEKSGGGEKSPVGFIVLYDRTEPAVCSNFVARVRLKPGMDSRFWTYVHGFNYDSRLTARSIKQSTGIQNLDEGSYLDEKVAMPTIREQVAIADYLDRETAEIDAFIVDQEELIALLTERRLATVSAHFDSVVAVSESGKKSSYSRLGLVIVETDERVGELVRDLFSVSIHRGLIPWTEMHDKPPKASEFSNYRAVDPGEIVLNRMRAFQGAAGLAVVPGMVSPDYAVFKVAPTSHPRYIELLFRSAPFIEAIKLRLRGIGDEDSGMIRTPRINVRDLIRIGVALPGLEEQWTIVRSFDREMADIDAAIADAREAIALSKERRAALISAAVTGKIDVRNHRGVD